MWLGGLLRVTASGFSREACQGWKITAFQSLVDNAPYHATNEVGKGFRIFKIVVITNRNVDSALLLLSGIMDTLDWYNETVAWD